MVGSVNVRIDGVNERGNGVLRTSKLMRECDVAVLIRMQALPDKLRFRDGVRRGVRRTDS